MAGIANGNENKSGTRMRTSVCVIVALVTQALVAIIVVSWWFQGAGPPEATGDEEHARRLSTPDKAKLPPWLDLRIFSDARSKSIFHPPVGDKYSLSSSHAAAFYKRQKAERQAKERAETKEVDPRKPPAFAKIYYCGGLQAWFQQRPEKYSTSSLVWMSALLPEIEHESFMDYVPLTHYTLKQAREWDVLVMHSHRWCQISDLTAFPGRQLHFNAEFYDIHPRDRKAGRRGERMLDYLPPGDRSFVLGPHADSDRSIRVPLVTMQSKLLGDQTYRATLFDPARKPKNSGDRFMLYVNSHWVKFRELAAHQIATRIAPIHVAGKCQAHVELFQGPRAQEPPNWPTETAKPPKCQPYTKDRPDYILLAPEMTQFTTFGRNFDIFKKYRFALVLENVYSDGYISEKILNAFLSGAVPVYYGTTEVFDIFNPNAFIYYDIHDPEPALARIQQLESDPEEYQRVLNEPILAHGEETIAKYFSWTDDVGGGLLKKRIRAMMGYDP